jgi:hypothetical protein
MITGLGDLHARRARGDALSQPAREGAGGRALGAVDGPGDHALVRHRQALRTGELADGVLSRSGAQT